jgi:hypothetical protein
MNENNNIQKQTSMAQKLIESLLQYYAPAASLPESDETKTTNELIEEMEPIQGDIYSGDVNTLMETNGFVLQYTGSGYVWLLKIR